MPADKAVGVLDTLAEGDEKGNIKEIDFDTCKTRLIAPQKGQRLRTVGFMNEDLIYGMLNKEDILTDEEGHKSVGIRILRIEDFEGNVKKEYRKDGLYITDISVGNTLIEFELSAKSGETSYVAQKKDTIMNNKKAAANTVKIELISASRTGVRVKLVFNTTKQTDSPLTMYAQVSPEGPEPITATFLPFFSVGISGDTLFSLAQSATNLSSLPIDIASPLIPLIH